MTVEQLLRAVDELSPDEQLRLLTELTHRLVPAHRGTRSITELRGLGREV